MNRKIFLLSLPALAFSVHRLSASTRPFVYDTATGKAPSVDRLYRDFYIYVDMSPSPTQAAISNASRSYTNDFYYKDANGALKQTVTKSGAAKSTYSDYYSNWNLKWWTDFEVKVIDKWGNTLYFSSTIALKSQTNANGHAEIIDKTPQIYYLPMCNDYQDGQCFGLKTQFTDFTKSIGGTVGSNTHVSGVWFYPSISSAEKRSVKFYTGRYAGSYKSVVWGEYIREIFTNPENLIIVWRQTTTVGEYLSNYVGESKYWRAVQPTYFGDFKIKQ